MRSPNTRAAWTGSGSSSRIENAARVPITQPNTYQRARPYASHSGASSSAANFVQPARAAKKPRASGIVTSQKPKIRSAGMIASFVFEFDEYCVNG